LPQGIDSPNRRWQPADQRDLKNQANHTRDGAPDGEERNEWQKDGQQQAQFEISESDVSERMFEAEKIHRAATDVNDTHPSPAPP
jgi:hypothetical protein